MSNVVGGGKETGIFMQSSWESLQPFSHLQSFGQGYNLPLLLTMLSACI